MPAKNQKIPLEKAIAYGEIIFALMEGKTSAVSISKELNKTNPTVFEQLRKLVQKGYVIKENQEYKIDKEALVDYWIKKFNINKNDKKLAIEKFDIIFNFPLFIGFSFPSIKKAYKMSIDEMGKNMSDMLAFKRDTQSRAKLEQFFKLLE
ncbi:MAG: winged helix-turn-helix domain-containing protein [archaeon]